LVNPEVIRKRINKLDEYLSILNRLKEYSADDFINNPQIYGSAERFLHLSIETITDMGNHVVAQSNLGIINWYSDIPTILEEKGIISDIQKDKWIRMIGFRNILIHDYLKIDRKLVYQNLQQNLDDFKELKKVFIKFL